MVCVPIDPMTVDFVDFWMKQMECFVSRNVDQKRGATRFDAVTLRVALGVHCRSPAAFSVLSKLLQLPKERTLQGYCGNLPDVWKRDEHNSSKALYRIENAYVYPAGLNPDPFVLSMEEARRKNVAMNTFLRGVLIMDEVSTTPYLHRLHA